MLPHRTELPTLVKSPALFSTRYRWALIILLIGATADVITTLINLQRYGPGVEVHLAQRMVSQIIGVTLGVPIAKVIQLAFVILIAAWWRPWCAAILCLCGLLYSCAAISNHFLLL
jgi:hypothetical protein